MGPEPKTAISQQLGLDPGDLQHGWGDVVGTDSGLGLSSGPSCELHTHQWLHTGHTALHTKDTACFPEQGSHD